VNILGKLGPQHVLGTAALAAGPVSVYAPAGLTLICVIAGLAALLLLWRDGRLADLASLPVAAIFTLLLAWGAISAVWALHPTATLTLARGLAILFLAILGMIVAAGTLDTAGKQSLCVPILVGFALCLLPLGVEIFSGDAVSRWIHAWQHGTEAVSFGVVDRALVLLLLFGFVAALALRQRGWMLAGSAAMLPALFLSGFANSQSARLSAAAGLAVFIGVWFLGRRLVLALGALAVLFVAVVPLLPLGPLAPTVVKPFLIGLKYSALHRFYIWEFVAHRIVERPLLGWGLNSARDIPGGDREAPGGGILLGLHPHDGPLQVWLELGLPGAALFAALLWLTFAAIARLEDRFARAVTAGMAVTAFGIACLSFGIWQTWWVATLGLSAGLAVALAKPAPWPQET
jgi:exopolysaccharide production protein ExoQ